MAGSLTTDAATEATMDSRMGTRKQLPCTSTRTHAANTASRMYVFYTMSFGIQQTRMYSMKRHLSCATRTSDCCQPGHVPLLRGRRCASVLPETPELRSSTRSYLSTRMTGNGLHPALSSASQLCCRPYSTIIQGSIEAAMSSSDFPHNNKTYQILSTAQKQGYAVGGFCVCVTGPRQRH